MGTILNTVDDDTYQKTYPQLSSKRKGEVLKNRIYIQILDLNPSPETVQKFSDAIKEWNDTHLKKTIPSPDPNGEDCMMMKLVLRNTKYFDQTGRETKLKMIGSVRELVTNSQKEMIGQAHADAVWFKERGFTVCREKIVTLNAKIKDRFINEHPSKYFDTIFNLTKQMKSSDRKTIISSEDLSSIDPVYRHYKSQYSTPILVEWYDPAQEKRETIFIVRHRGQTQSSVDSRVESIKGTMPGHTRFHVQTESTEYCWYDSFPAMDIGALDYTEKELQQIQGKERGTTRYKQIIEDF